MLAIQSYQTDTTPIPDTDYYTHTLNILAIMTVDEPDKCQDDIIARAEAVFADVTSFSTIYAVGEWPMIEVDIQMTDCHRYFALDPEYFLVEVGADYPSFKKRKQNPESIESFSHRIATKIWN